MNGNSKPFFADYDKDGQVELLVGSLHGGIEVYENPPANAVDTATYVGLLFDYDFGAYTAVTAAVIDSTQELTYLVGGYKGGILMYKVPLSASPDTTVGITIPVNSLVFSLYPNPAKSNITVSLSDENMGRKRVEMLNFLGQTMYQGVFTENEKTIEINAFPEGIYFVKVEAQKGVAVKRLIIRK